MWKKLSLISLTLWFLTIGVLGYFFYFGSTIKGIDQRIEIVLSKQERNMVLGEMRGLLKGVQSIIRLATKNDFKEVAITARSMGMIMATEDGHPALIAKLPFAFKTMGFGVHKSFDKLADHAESLNANQVLNETADIMNSCVSCHAAYRISDH